MAVEQHDRNVVIADLVRDGKLTFHAIGERYGLSRERVRQIAAKQGVRWPRGYLRNLPDEKIYAALDLIGRGVPIAHAADTIGLNRKSLGGALQVRGLREPEHDDRLWTDAETTFLRAHYKQPGWPASKIAAKLDRTRFEVIGKANRLKLCKSVDPSKTVSGRVRALLSANGTLTSKQIATRLGCSLLHAQHEKWRCKNPEAEYRARHRYNTRQRAVAQGDVIVERAA